MAEDIEVRKDGRPSANGIGSVHVKTWPSKRYPKAGTLANTKVGKSSGQTNCFITQTIILDILRFYQMCSWFREIIQKSSQRGEPGFLGGRSTRTTPTIPVLAGEPPGEPGVIPGCARGEPPHPCLTPGLRGQGADVIFLAPLSCSP